MWCVVSVQRKLFFIICGLLLGLCPLTHANNSPNFRFEHLLNYFSDNEKPHGKLPFIVQDHQGMVWLGGEKIYRFDGLEFKPYLENTNPYCSTFILSMVVDKTGVLWVATEKGICIYDAPTDQFVPFIASSGATVSIYVSTLAVSPTNEVYVGSRNQLAIISASRSSILYYPVQVANVKADATNDFRAIYFESKNRVWVGTMASGLLHFSPQTGQYQQVLNSQQVLNNQQALNNQQVLNKLALPVADIRTIAMDDSGFLWLGLHQGGVSKYNPATKILKNYLTPNDDYGLGSHYIWHIIKDSQGMMWLTTDGDGLMYYDAANDSFEHYRHKASDPSSIASNKPIAIFEDREKNLWVSLYPEGLDLVNRQHEKIKRFKYQGENASSINDDGILSIFEDSQNTLWIGTEKGLNRYIPRTNSFENYSAPGADWQIPPVPVTAIAEDTHKNLWLSTWGSGLYRYNDLTKTVTHFKPQANNPKTVDTAILWRILIDGDKLWFNSEGVTGLLMFDQNTQTFERQPLVTPAGNADMINSYDMLQDDQQQLWVASTNGLYVVSADRQSATLLSSSQLSALTITSFRTQSLLQDNNGDIWVGTADQGLFRFNQATHTFTHLSSLNLPSPTIMRIQQSADGNLWLFTLNGLVRLNPKNLEHKIWNTTQGLVDGNFNRGAGFIDSQQTVYAGGAQGLSIFNIADLDAEPANFPVHVTGFKLFNQAVPIGPASALKQNIMVTDRIVLDYTQSIFTLYFAGLSYPLSRWNRYAFMLEGYDKQWNYVGDTHSATYTNIPAGEYVFAVKAQNSNGSWSQQIDRLTIEITPAPWQTWWAYCLYLLVALMVFQGIFYYRIQRLKYQKEKLLNAEIIRLNAIKEDIRRDFMADISHELRTPLSILSGEIEAIQDGIRPLSMAALESLGSEITIIKNIVNDLYDLALSDTGALNYAMVPVDVGVALNHAFAQMGTKFERLHIAASIHITHTPLMMMGDSLRLHQLFLNILENTARYTDEHGQVMIKAYRNQNAIVVDIQDSEPGVAKDEIKQLFNRFYRVDRSRNREHGGSGLGLSICKNIALAHKGTIELHASPLGGLQVILRFTALKS